MKRTIIVAVAVTFLTSPAWSAQAIVLPDAPMHAEPKSSSKIIGRIAQQIKMMFRAVETDSAL